MHFPLAITVALTTSVPLVAGFLSMDTTLARARSVKTTGISALRLQNTVTASATETLTSKEQAVGDVGAKTESSVEISAEAIKERLESMLASLRVKDATSRHLTKQELDIVFEDDHIVVINKPSGVLSVTSNGDHPNLAKSVFEAIGSESDRADMMVVHRLGMDTSGLMVFAKTNEALRGMNTVFRTRSIERKYEALVCGHLEKDEGIIDLPLMRDYVCPPFIRVSTDAHQRKLLQVDPEKLDKKYMCSPKESLTKYSVVSREDLNGQPVTRVSLTSISGRTHQLNVHLAAFGHPIVGDTIYGLNGWALENGGLTESEQDAMIPNASRASVGVQRAIAETSPAPCVHAKSLKFRHPVTKKQLSLSVDAPF